jgi:hypothetical protein
VVVDTTLAVTDLPVTDAAPSQPLAAHGTTYLELSLDGIRENGGINCNSLATRRSPGTSARC